ncbi:hypothetical protein [Lacihabitans lacunae]|uniref:Glycosyltransferase RgtA/B/C/D-like domain-containing protein n=1 Tax=Lacihabitans lacunae TaxID=1028214 RepID=A0ABV7Z0B7_9BACT
MNIRTLSIVTILYLLLPNIIFLFCWLDNPYNFLTIPPLLASYFWYVGSKYAYQTSGVPLKSALTVLILSAIIVVVSGTGGYFPQCYDFWTHNARLNDLYEHAFPATLQNNHTYYAYYFGFYLTPVLISKILGGYLLFTNFAYLTLGVFVGLMWFIIYFEFDFKKIILGLLVSTPSIFFLNFITFGFYSKYVHVGNNLWLHDFFKGLQWEPHQLIPSFIFAGLILFETKNHKWPILAILIAPLTVLWGPFVSMSITSILVFYVIINGINKSDFYLFKQYKLIFSLLLVIVSCLPILFFLGSNQMSGKFEVLPAIGRENGPFAYLIFILLNFGLLGLFLIFKVKQNRAILISVLIYLSVASILKLGYYNDFLIKSTLLPLLILHFSFGSVAVKHFKTFIKSPSFILLFIIYISGFIPTLKNQTKDLKLSNVFLLEKNQNSKVFDAYTDIHENLLKRYTEREAYQYHGDMNSFYARKLAPKSIEKSIKLNAEKRSKPSN